MYFLFTDGGARGNPGPAAAGVVLKDADGNVLKELGIFLGTTTNNEAEYKALISGLKTVVEAEVKEVLCILDSELIVKQLKGAYRVKSPTLKILFDEVKALEKNFTRIGYKHVPRAKNKHADRLVNEVLDNLNS